MKLCMMTIAILTAASAAFSHQPPDSLWSVGYDQGHIDELMAIIQTPDCGYLGVGCSNVSAGTIYGTVFLMKTENDGTLEWTRGYSYNAVGCAVVATADSGYFIAGYSNNYNYSVLAMKVNAAGDSLWCREYGGVNTDLAMSMQTASDGGYMLLGFTESFGQGQPGAADFWLLRINGSGDSLWSRTYGGSGNEYANALIRCSDGGYALAGHTNSFGSGNDDFWLVKTNANGDSLWSRSFGSAYQDRCYGAIQTADSGYMLAGYRYYGWGTRDAWLVKTNANGDSIWSRTYGGGQNDAAFSVVQTPDGGYVFGGETWSYGFGFNDMWLVGVNATGDYLWSRTYGGSFWDEYCRGLLQDSRGAFILAGVGVTISPTRTRDAWIVKTDYTKPHFASITDVGNDQGRQVRIRWQRPSYDLGGASFTVHNHRLQRLSPHRSIPAARCAASAPCSFRLASGRMGVYRFRSRTR